MARYRQLIVQGETGWYLMNPRNPWEALKLAWYLWRYPDRVGALVSVSQEFMLAKCKPESPNVRINGQPEAVPLNEVLGENKGGVT